MEIIKYSKDKKGYLKIKTALFSIPKTPRKIHWYNNNTR